MIRTLVSSALLVLTLLVPSATANASLSIAQRGPGGSATPVESPTLRPPVKAPVVGNPCTKPGHSCRPRPVGPAR